MPRLATIFEKKKRVHYQKGHFPCEKQAFGRGVMVWILEKLTISF